MPAGFKPRATDHIPISIQPIPPQLQAHCAVRFVAFESRFTTGGL